MPQEVFDIKLLSCTSNTANLKIKGFQSERGKKHLFEINKKSYSGIADSGGSPDSGLMRRQGQGTFMRKRRGQGYPEKEGIAVGADNSDVYSKEWV